MDQRELLEALRASGELAVVEREVDRRFEMARVIRALGDRPVLFERVKGTGTPVAANLCARREHFARALGVPVHRLLYTLAQALAHPAEPPTVGRAPCQQIIEPSVDLNQIPILTDRGFDQITPVIVIRHPDSIPGYDHPLAIT